MLGARVWGLSIDKDKLPALESFIAPFTWESNTVGEPLSYLLTTDGKSKFWDEETQNWLYQIEGGRHNPNLGFYAFTDTVTLEKELCDFEYYEIVGAITGLVNGYGKIHRHTNGYRSEYQKITAICHDTVRCTFLYCENPGNFYITMYNKDPDFQVVQTYCSDCFNANRGDVKDNMKFVSGGSYMQYAHDKFFKDLSAKYDVSLISYNELKGILEQ